MSFQDFINNIFSIFPTFISLLNQLFNFLIHNYIFLVLIYSSLFIFIIGLLFFVFNLIVSKLNPKIKDKGE